MYANDRDGVVGEKGLRLGREEVDIVARWGRGSGEDWSHEAWPFEEDMPMRG